ICNSNGSLSSDGAGSTSHIPASHLGENKPLLLRVFKAVVPQEDSLGKGSFQSLDSNQDGKRQMKEGEFHQGIVSQGGETNAEPLEEDPETLIADPWE
uniref:Uncharacterized protein n=1 Tax=Urocitellus parryii TaxID=9999 RepID=A0A8D2KC68_UROPR